MNAFRAIATITLTTGLILNTSCAEKLEELASDGGDGTFTATDIEKTWASSCIAGTDPISIGTHHKFELRLISGGTYRFSDTWYSAAGCSPVNYLAMYATEGTYTVGAVVSGSAQAIDFVATVSTVMPFTNGFQDDMNDDCGGSSPFTAGGYETLGGTYSTYMVTCQSAPFANSGDNDFNNIATYSGGVLSIGVNEFGVPGVFAGNALPASATIDFN